MEEKVGFRRWLSEFEPAAARSVVVAVVALAGTLGVGELATSLEPLAYAIVGVIAAASALVAGAAARGAVYSPATVDKLLEDQEAFFHDAPDPEVDAAAGGGDDVEEPDGDYVGDEGADVEDADEVESFA